MIIKNLDHISDVEKETYISMIETKKNLHNTVPLEKNILDYISQSMWRFNMLGFIEIPDYKEHSVMELNKFSTIYYKNTGHSKFFIPVGLMIEKEPFFNDDNVSQGSYVIYFLGNDNTSYGQRFHSKDEALLFVEKGWQCGFEDLMWYNS